MAWDRTGHYTNRQYTDPVAYEWREKGDIKPFALQDCINKG
jgi:hypothetical protein